MDKIRNKIVEKFGNRLRVRVCGICIEHKEILLVNHQSLNEGNDFWSPPGGGMEFGISAEENLKREFLEETGLNIEVGKFLFVHEYLGPPLHAIELIYEVHRKSGRLKTGIDPELGSGEQIIKNVRFWNFDEIAMLEGASIHQMFNHLGDVAEVVNTNGYFLWKTGN